MLMYLIVMGEPQVMQLFGESVYPLIRNACLFNRSHPRLTRGMDFFRNNKCIYVLSKIMKSLILRRRIRLRTQVVGILPFAWSVFTCSVSGFPGRVLLTVSLFTCLLIKCQSKKELSFPNLHNLLFLVKKESEKLKRS